MIQKKVRRYFNFPKYLYLFEGLTRVVFKKSPPMATYSLSFIVSNYKRMAEYGPQALGLYTPENGWDKRHLDYPVWIAHNVMELLVAYLKVPYPLKKMDLAIVPDLSVEAVAHWGLSTFK